MYGNLLGVQEFLRSELARNFGDEVACCHGPDKQAFRLHGKPFHGIQCFALNSQLSRDIWRQRFVDFAEAHIDVELDILVNVLRGKV